jgi:hypothetical protein
MFVRPRRRPVAAFFLPEFFLSAGLAQYRTPYGIFTLLREKININNKLEYGTRDEKIGILLYGITTNSMHEFPPMGQL